MKTAMERAAEILPTKDGANSPAEVTKLASVVFACGKVVRANRPLETEIIFRAHQKPRRKFAMAWVSYAWADAGLKQAKPCHVMHPVGLVHI